MTPGAPSSALQPAVGPRRAGTPGAVPVTVRQAFIYGTGLGPRCVSSGTATAEHRDPMSHSAKFSARGGAPSPEGSSEVAAGLAARARPRADVPVSRGAGVRACGTPPPRTEAERTRPRGSLVPLELPPVSRRPEPRSAVRHAPPRGWSCVSSGSATTDCMSPRLGRPGRRRPPLLGLTMLDKSRVLYTGRHGR